VGKSPEGKVPGKYFLSSCGLVLVCYVLSYLTSIDTTVSLKANSRS
jgi:hypothetical protein